MGFLTNDTTIVDAILTDEGRRRISEGTFEIAKFSFSDDEIVYSKAQQTNFLSKFSETPIFEAISENIRAIKYKLLSMDGSYTHLTATRLVTEKGPQNGTPQASNSGATYSNVGYYVIIATEATYDDHYQSGAVSLPDGYLPGYSKKLTSKSENNYIKIDHGVNDDGSDNATYQYDQALPSELAETQFMVKLDYRLGRIITVDGLEVKPNYIDDDFIATYIITTNSYPEFFESLIADYTSSPIKGSRGLRLKLPVAAATNINTSSTAIWTDLGRSISNFFTNGTTTARVIDATLDIQGMTTSVNITVPLRFVKNA